MWLIYLHDKFSSLFPHWHNRKSYSVKSSGAVDDTVHLFAFIFYLFILKYGGNLLENTFFP